MESVASLKVAQQLNGTINQLYAETISRLEGAMQSVCNDFHAGPYMKVWLGRPVSSLLLACSNMDLATSLALTSHWQCNMRCQHIMV